MQNPKSTERHDIMMAWQKQRPLAMVVGQLSTGKCKATFKPRDTDYPSLKTK